MQDRERVRRGLQRIGLSEYESEAYLTVIEHGPLAAVDVAGESGIPSSRIYDVLTDLEHDGYVRTFEREDRRYVEANEPSDIVSILRETGDRLSETAEEIEEAWEQRSIVDHEINLVSETDSALDVAKAYIERAETSVDVAVTTPQYYQLRDALSVALANDVTVRVSLEDAPAQIDSDQPVTELRSRTIPGPFLVIADRTHTCFAPNDRAPSEYGLVLNDRILSFIFRWYFQMCLWATCDPIHVSDAEGRVYVSMEEFVRNIYPFWARGAVVPVTISGTDLDTGEPCEISGIVSEVVYPNAAPNRTPSYVDMAGMVTLVVTDEDGRDHFVGSWGAVYEDMEAERIVLHSSQLALTPSLPSDRWLDELAED